MTEQNQIIAVSMAVTCAIAVGLGVLIALVAVIFSRFLNRNVPSEKAMKEFDQAQAAQLEKGRQSGIRRPGQVAEPILATIVCFFGVFVLITAFSPIIPNAMASREQVHSGATTPAAPAGKLAVTGNFAEIVAALPPGHPEAGQGLFLSQGCSGCHSLTKGQTMVGPSLAGAFTTAATRRPPLGAKEYLYESIVSPNAYVVQGFQPNLMQQTFASTLSPQQMADILAWMERDLK